MTRSGPPTQPELPRSYRALLVTYPRSWIAAHGAVVLDTLLTLHAEHNRTRPSAADHLGFAIDGIRVRFAMPHGRHPVLHFAAPEALAPSQTFDQSNGLVQDTRFIDEWEQVHANAAAGQNNDEQRIAPDAWFKLNASSRTNIGRHSRRHTTS